MMLKEYFKIRNGQMTQEELFERKMDGWYPIKEG